MYCRFGQHARQHIERDVGAGDDAARRDLAAEEKRKKETVAQHESAVEYQGYRGNRGLVEHLQARRCDRCLSGENP